MPNNVLSIQSEKVQKILFWTISFIIILPILVLPPTFIPSNWSRAILFRTAIILLISFLFYRFFYKKDLSFSILKKKNPSFLPLLTLSAFFVIVLISTLFSEDIRFSIFGSPGRAGGIINLLFYFLFAIFLSIFIKEEYWEKLIKVNFIAGAIASIFAIIQYFGFLNSIFVRFSEGGIPSLIGNSTPLAIYMIFMAFSAFNSFLKEGHKNKKWGYGALVILFLFTILITGSRAAYLGMLISSLFYLLLYPKKIKLLKIFAVSIIVLGFITVLIFNFFPQIGQTNNLLKTVSSRLSFEKIFQDLTGNRMPAWIMTSYAIKEKPLLGWGAENFYIGFEKYYKPVNETLQREWWDRPHNIFLDVFIHYGIFGLLLYIAFWIFLIIKLQIFKKNEQDLNKVYLAHGIQAMFIGYLTVLFFNFDEFTTYLISFFFIGLSFYLISLHGEKTEMTPAYKNILGKKPVSIFLLLLIILFIWFWNIKPLYINERITYAGNLISTQRCDEGISMVEKSWKKAGILKTHSALNFAYFIKSCAEANPQKEIEYAQKSTEALKEVSVIQPQYSRTWILMGGFTNVLAAREGNLEERSLKISQARQYLQKARELSPQRIEALIQLEINYMIAEDYKSMEKTAEECIQINPRLGTCYWYLGIAQIFSGKKVDGDKNIAESKVKGFTDPPLLQLAAAYLNNKHYKDASKIYDYLTERYGNPDFYAISAALAKELGDYPKAAKMAIEVFKIKPDDQESLQFLEELFVVSRDPSLIESSLYSIARIYKETGEKTKNIEMLIKSKDVYLRLINLYPYNTGYKWFLRDVYLSLVEQDPNNTKYRLSLRDFYINLINQSPNNTPYRWTLVEIYLGLKDYYKAREEVIKIVKIDPNDLGKAQGYLNRMPIEEQLKILP